MQTAIYQLSLRAGVGEVVYVLQIVGLLPLELDPARFRRAFETVVARHDALRLRFVLDGRPEPVQYAQKPKLPWTQRNLSGVSEEKQDEELAAYLIRDRRTGFDLTSEPPLRLLFEQLGPSRCRFVWTIHHAAIDSRSLTCVLDEVFQIYDALAAGESPALPASPPFLDYVGRLGALSFKAEEAFWRERLKGFAAPSDLKFPVGGGKGYGERSMAIKAETLKALSRRTTDLGVTVNVLLQGAWAMTLARFSGCDDVVFGATKSVRHGPGEQDGVGLYLNTLAVRVVYNPDMGLGDWLRRIRENWISAWPFENAPYRLQRACSDITSRAPLYNSLLIVDRESLDGQLKRLHPNWGRGSFHSIEHTPFPIAFATNIEEGMVLNMEFDRSVLADADAERAMETFAHVFQVMVATPGDCPLGDVPLFPEKDLRFLLRAGRGDVPEAAIPECAYRAFERMAEASPDSPALVDGDETLTYGRLRARVEGMAARLVGLRLKRGEAVVICLPRSFDLITAMYAAWKVGAFYVPVDTGLPDARKEYILEHVRAKAAVSKRGFMPAGVDIPVLLLDSGLEPEAPSGARPQEASPEDPAYVLYTSGTTGAPKGVVTQRCALSAFLKAVAPEFGFGPGDRILQFASASFDAAAEEIHGALTTGATLVLRNAEMAGSAEAFFEFCEQHRVSVISLPTAFWNVLAATMPEGCVPKTLRLVIVGGEQARFSTLSSWRLKAGRRIRLLDAYGPTEATVEVVVTDLTDYAGPDDPPLGKVLPGTRAYVLNSRLEPLPIRVEGEMCLAGDQLAQGYLDDPERTAEAFRPAGPLNRLLASAGFPPEIGPIYRTGDLVRLREDGGYDFIGRKDDQVKVRGYRIELGEIESRLAALPEIAMAAVKVVEDPPGNRFIAAYAVPERNARGDGLDVLESRLALEVLARKGLHAVLPVFMLPGAYIFLDSLPLTANGKVDYQALPAPRDRVAKNPSDAQYADELERIAAEVLEDALGVRDVGPTSDFFALGGDSLSAIIVASALQHRTGVALPTMVLYQAPTPRLLSKFLREAAPVKAGILEPIQPEGSNPPLFFVGATSLLGPLANKLGTDQPLFSLNAFGLQPLLEEDETLDLRAIAEIYINEIRRARGKGPYLLAGYCLDAVLAFEMAQQLRQAGEETALLLSIDGVWDAGSRGLGIKRHLDNLQIFGPSYLVSKFRQKYRQWRTGLLLSYSRFKAFLAKPGASSVPASLKNALFLDMFFKSFESYEAEPYEGRITLFLSSEWNSLELPELSALAEGGLDIHEIRGFHDGWFNQPQVDVFAAKLKECIAAALERGHD